MFEPMQISSRRASGSRLARENAPMNKRQPFEQEDDHAKTAVQIAASGPIKRLNSSATRAVTAGDAGPSPPFIVLGEEGLGEAPTMLVRLAALAAPIAVVDGRSLAHLTV